MKTILEEFRVRIRNFLLTKSRKILTWVEFEVVANLEGQGEQPAGNEPVNEHAPETETYKFEYWSRIGSTC